MNCRVWPTPPRGDKRFRRTAREYLSAGIRGLPLLFLSLFLLSLANNSGAKEETAYLSFRKSATGPSGTTVYTVKKGEWLLGIVQKVTGQTRNRLAIVRKYNPTLKDLNRIYPGQRIVLPLRTKRPPPPTAEKPKLHASPTATGAEILPGGDTLPLSAGKWSIIERVLGEIGATVSAKGKYHLPLRDMGQINIDCGKIPLVEFPDHGMVFIDFRNQLSDDLSGLLRQTWKSIQALQIDPRLPATEILARIIGASGSHEMRLRKEPLPIGTPRTLEIRLDWIIRPKAAFATRGGRNLALRIRRDDGPALPGPIRRQARAQGWEILDIKDDSLIEPSPEEVYAPRPTAHLSSQSHLEMAADLFQRMNLEIGRNTDLKIFEASREGFDLIIKAEATIARGENRLVLSNRRLPNQFLDILKKRHTEVITPEAQETKTSFLTRSCLALGIDHETGSFSLPLATKGDLSDTVVILSGMKIVPDAGRPFYLTEVDPGEGVSDYLYHTLGVLVITY
ncbi:MAG: hypothetical protein QM278_03155 [Pseudomonadota bacterium]|nr:hypothetical protein [Pseudomonadota bacterium]